jgi:hypothetical protein
MRFPRESKVKQAALIYAHSIGHLNRHKVIRSAISGVSRSVQNALSARTPMTDEAGYDGEDAISLILTYFVSPELLVRSDMLSDQSYPQETQ